MLAIEKLSPSKPGIYSPNEMAESGGLIYILQALCHLPKRVYLTNIILKLSKLQALILTSLRFSSNSKDRLSQIIYVPKTTKNILFSFRSVSNMMELAYVNIYIHVKSCEFKFSDITLFFKWYLMYQRYLNCFRKSKYQRQQSQCQALLLDNPEKNYLPTCSTLPPNMCMYLNIRSPIKLTIRPLNYLACSQLRDLSS